jgi:hypothetical protein
MLKALFIVRHEYQYWVASAIIRKLQISHPVFAIMGNWKPVNEIYESFHLPDIDMRARTINKIAHLFLSNIRKVSVEGIFCPTNLDPFINRFMRKQCVKYINIFDEGGGAVYSYLSPKKWYNLPVLMGLQDRRWGEGSQIDSIFTPNPEIFSNDIKTELIDIAPEMRSVAEELYKSTLDQVERGSVGGVVVLTQPYPADYLGPHEDGNSILFKFATDRWGSVFVKAHPREFPASGDQGKFKELPVALQRIPIQAIAMKFPIDSIVSNCSSALLNTAKISGRSINSYSLIDKVSKTKLTEPFKAAAVKIDGLVLV